MLQGVESGDVRSVHRTRVATRRLREILPVLQLDARVADKLNRSLRRMTGRLGAIRELDVILLLAEDLHGTGRYAQDALRRIADEARAARTGALDDLRTRSLGAELKGLARKLASVADKLEREDRKAGRARPWVWAIEARVARRASVLQKAIGDAGALYLPERLHAVRIALKKLRYALELSVDARRSAPRAKRADPSADLAILKRGQVTLGRLHDLQVLIERARRAQTALDPPELGPRRELDRLIVVVERECRRLHARYVRQRGSISAICDNLVARSGRTLRRAG